MNDTSVVISPPRMLFPSQKTSHGMHLHEAIAIVLMRVGRMMHTASQRADRARSYRHGEDRARPGVDQNSSTRYSPANGEDTDFGS